MDNKFSPEIANRVATALNEKKISTKCPLCPDGRLTLVDGFTATRTGKNIRDLATLTGEFTVFPCAGLVCQNCGYFVQFSLAVLGLLDLFREEGKNG